MAFLEALLSPLASRASPEGGRLDLGVNLAQHSDDCAGIESFARPFWGLAPWAAGGGDLAKHPWALRGLAHAFDPSHPEYWGDPVDHDQRCIEAGAIAVACLVAPAQFWEPLAPQARAHFAAWVAKLNACALPDNNWLLHRAMANLALVRGGEPHDGARMVADLDRIESFAVGEGWYSDGPHAQLDHYVGFAMHALGLLYATHAVDREPARCERLRGRAARFAKDYAAWFDAEGRALPFGRSLSYRFAQAAFWGALAHAGLEALPWATVKGLWIRNLRSWSARPILDAEGLLTAGYEYPNAMLGEQYNGPGSPYLALQAFLPLALDESHPFWQANEAPASRDPSTMPQPAPRMLVCRADEGRHVFALNGGQWAPWAPRHDAAKYAKFCYSTVFGFSVASSAAGLEAGAPDSMLALSDDNTWYRVRRETAGHEVFEHGVASTWRPWPDVEVRTWLFAAGPWHLRAHRILSRRRLVAAECGFAVPWAGSDRRGGTMVIGDRHAAAGEPGAPRCEIVEIEGTRRGLVFLAHAATNVIQPRTVIPALAGPIAEGETWLACAILGTTVAEPPAMPFAWRPLFRGFRVEGPGYAYDLTV